MLVSASDAVGGQGQIPLELDYRGLCDGSWTQILSKSRKRS